MKDIDGFTIKCIHSEWKVVDARDNKDFVCMNSYLTQEHYCHGDENCRYYKPEIKDDKAVRIN